MLQHMQERVKAEGERQEATYKKFMCYCKNSGGNLGESIAAAETKIPEVSGALSEAEDRKAQQTTALAKAKTDKADAKKAIAEATALREKEAATFAEFKSTYSTNIQAIVKAVKMLEKGMAGSFLQTRDAGVLKKLAFSSD